MGMLRERYGFTMVEISVVLVGIAIITAMGISAGSSVLESTRRVSTEKKLDQIEAAMIRYRDRFGRLPCPGAPGLLQSDANYGVEAETPGDCTGGTPAATATTAEEGVWGSVPTHSLGLNSEFMYDAWGRKFQYEVTRSMTAQHSFAASQPGDSCSYEVENASGNALAKKAVYTLVSFGKNGTGGYLKNGTEMDGSSSTKEELNIRSINNDAYVAALGIVRDEREDATYYDDLVRYVFREQMEKSSTISMPTFDGPDMLLGYDTSMSGQITFGKRSCGIFTDFTNTLPDVGAGSPRIVAFTPNNHNIFVYYDQGGSHFCRLYTFINGEIFPTYGELDAECPEATKASAALSAPIIATINDTSPYLQPLRLSGTMSHMTSQIMREVEPLPAEALDNVSISADGAWIAVSSYDSFKALYRLDEKDVYKMLPAAAQPDTSLTVHSNAISPSGKYYAAAVVNGGNTDIYVWNMVEGGFNPFPGTLAASFTVTGMNAPTVLSFSPDSSRIVVGGGGTANIAVLMIDAANQTLRSMLSDALSPVPVSAAFTHDTTQLAVARSGSGASSIALYRLNGAAYEAETPQSSLTLNGSANALSIAMANKPANKLSCTLPWPGPMPTDSSQTKIADGDKVTVHQYASGSTAECASTETRTCNNGTLASGSYYHQSCTITSCTLPWGGTINIGDDVTAYDTASSTAPCAGTSETRECTSTGLTGSYTNQSCSTACLLPWKALPSSTFSGAATVDIWIPHGEDVTAYEFYNPSQNGGTCTGVNTELRTCTNGVLSGSYLYPGCASTYCVAEWGDFIYTSVTGYQHATGTTVQCAISQTRTCGAGSTLPSGTYTNPGCVNAETGSSCSTPWGQVIADQAWVTSYSIQNPPAGYPCPGAPGAQAYFVAGTPITNHIPAQYTYPGGTIMLVYSNRCNNGAFVTINNYPTCIPLP